MKCASAGAALFACDGEELRALLLRAGSLVQAWGVVCAPPLGVHAQEQTGGFALLLVRVDRVAVLLLDAALEVLAERELLPPSPTCLSGACACVGTRLFVAGGAGLLGAALRGGEALLAAVHWPGTGADATEDLRAAASLLLLLSRSEVSGLCAVHGARGGADGAHLQPLWTLSLSAARPLLCVSGAGCVVLDGRLALWLDGEGAGAETALGEVVAAAAGCPQGALLCSPSGALSLLAPNGQTRVGARAGAGAECAGLPVLPSCSSLLCVGGELFLALGEKGGAQAFSLRPPASAPAPNPAPCLRMQAAPLDHVAAEEALCAGEFSAALRCGACVFLAARALLPSPPSALPLDLEHEGAAPLAALLPSGDTLLCLSSPQRGVALLLLAEEQEPSLTLQPLAQGRTCLVLAALPPLALLVCTGGATLLDAALKPLACVSAAHVFGPDASFEHAAAATPSALLVARGPRLALLRVRRDALELLQVLSLEEEVAGLCACVAREGLLVGAGLWSGRTLLWRSSASSPSLATEPLALPPERAPRTLARDPLLLGGTATVLAVALPCAVRVTRLLAHGDALQALPSELLPVHGRLLLVRAAPAPAPRLLACTDRGWLLLALQDEQWTRLRLLLPAPAPSSHVAVVALPDRSLRLLWTHAQQLLSSTCLPAPPAWHLEQRWVGEAPLTHLVRVGGALAAGDAQGVSLLCGETLALQTRIAGPADPALTLRSLLAGRAPSSSPTREPCLLAVFADGRASVVAAFSLRGGAVLGGVRLSHGARLCAALGRLLVVFAEGAALVLGWARGETGWALRVRSEAAWTHTPVAAAACAGDALLVLALASSALLCSVHAHTHALAVQLATLRTSALTVSSQTVIKIETGERQVSRLCCVEAEGDGTVWLAALVGCGGESLAWLWFDPAAGRGGLTRSEPCGRAVGLLPCEGGVHVWRRDGTALRFPRPPSPD